MKVYNFNKFHSHFQLVWWGWKLGGFWCFSYLPTNSSNPDWRDVDYWTIGIGPVEIRKWKKHHE